MVENRIKEDNFFMTCFINGDKKSIIFANGIPSYITNHHPLVEFCKENRINLFIPRYYGTLESGGDFSLINCKKAIEKAITIVNGGYAKELFGNTKLQWKQKEIILLGYSFGALPSLLAEIDEEKIKRILVCPFLNLKINNEKGGNVLEELEYIERAYPNMFRFRASELKEDYLNLNYPSKRKFTAILGDKDKTLTKQEIEFMKEKYNPFVIVSDTGHTIPYEKLKEIL